jgi:hypothetical protein
MSVQKLCDNKTAYKHACRPPALCHGSQTRPRAAPRSQLHRECAANLPHYCPPSLRLVGGRGPYSARCLQDGGRERVEASRFALAGSPRLSSTGRPARVGVGDLGVHEVEWPRAARGDATLEFLPTAGVYHVH